MKTNRLSTWMPAAVVLVATAAIAGESGQTQTFTPKFTKGAEWRYTLNYNTTSKVAGMGQNTKSETQREVYVVARVKEIDAQGATFDFTYDRIVMNYKDEAKQLAFDSKNPASQDPKNGEFEQVRPICGQTFTLKVANSGEIIGLMPPANLPPSASLGGATKDFVTTDGVQRLFGAIWGFNSDKAYKPGDSWPVNRIVSDPPLDLRLTTNYKFESMKGDIATVTSNGQAIIEPRAPGAPMPFNLAEFKANGTYGWNTRLGALEHSNFTWVSQKTGDLQGMKLDMSQEYTLSLRRESK